MSSIYVLPFSIPQGGNQFHQGVHGGLPGHRRGDAVLPGLGSGLRPDTGPHHAGEVRVLPHGGDKPLDVEALVKVTIPAAPDSTAARSSSERGFSYTVR